MRKLIDSFFSDNRIALLLFLFFGCLCGAVFRFEQWFDFQNYHYYNSWAFLNDRINTDIAPAFVNTFYSPFLDLPFYFLVNKLNHHPVLFSTIMAVPYGLLLFSAYKISLLFFPSDSVQGRIRLKLAILLFICSEITFSQISTLTHEHLLSFVVLTVYYLILKDIRSSIFHKKTYSFAGFVMGAVAGLKLTYCPYAAACGLTLILFAKRIKLPFINIVLFTLAGTAGFLAAYGYWGWILWKNYQNPFFPFFNDFFQSPCWEGPSYRDTRYFDLPWLAVLFFPFLMFFNVKGIIPLISYFTPTNLIYPIGAIVFCVVLFKHIKNHFKHPDKIKEDDFPLIFLMTLIVFIYFFWLIFYRVHRYLIPLELLLLITLIHLYKKQIQTVFLYIVLLFIAALFIFRFPFLNYIRPYNIPILPDHSIVLPDDSLIILETYPVALYVPSLARNKTIPAVLSPLLDQIDVNGGKFSSFKCDLNKRSSLIKEMFQKETPIFFLTLNPSSYERISNVSCIKIDDVWLCPQ